jgi:antitoxin ParD1/3/4
MCHYFTDVKSGFGRYYEEFIAQNIKSGRFSSVSEAIRAGLRLLEEREIKILALRKALQEGEQIGFAEYTLSGLIEDLDQESAN